MANAMVSLHSSELGPLSWDGVTKRQLFLQKISSKLGPNARQQGRSIRVDKGPTGTAPPPGSETGLSGQGNQRPRHTRSAGSTQNIGAGCPTTAMQSQTQCQGIPKLRTTTERAFALADTGPATSSKPAVNQQKASCSMGRPAALMVSKLPVKELLTSLSSSSLGSNLNNGAISKGIKADDQPSRTTSPVSTASTRPLISSAATHSDIVSGANTATPRPPAMRKRAMSLQARTTATGVKTLIVSNNNTAKTAATNQAAAKVTINLASKNPLKRSGSTRLSRLNSTVDKVKPRDASSRPAKTNSNSKRAVPAGGNNQSQQQPPPDLVLDTVNANAPVKPVLPVPTTDATYTRPGTTGAHGLGSKARSESWSSPKIGSRQQNAPKPSSTEAAVADGTIVTKQSQSKGQPERKHQAITQLRKMLIQGNKRVEALATVIQHLFTEREEAMKQKKQLSLELSNLRDELATSSQYCKELQKEKEELRVTLEEALERLEEQHKEELVQLEDRLKGFYQTECDQVHQTYKEEADKCCMLMEQQVQELKSQQEEEMKNQEVSHSQKMESLKFQYETSIQELKRLQETDLENLEKTLEETKASLSEKISLLSAEKESLKERLKAEEERWASIMTDKNLKDSHTVYLEQELESLKVVLEIKNNQLHQKDKRLMEMDKLVETNVKLEECLNKVQQENEDYKARMDKHAALSKQLSNEQAILQQTLQKESKVNKRLSMENEELLWKLHNGDLLASPRHLSPTATFNSSQNSASLPTNAPLSPR